MHYMRNSLPLKYCKEIPQGFFEDSVWVWVCSQELSDDYELVQRKVLEECEGVFDRVLPAPTYEELLMFIKKTNKELYNEQL